MISNYFVYKVCILCEGYEEYDYLKKLKELNVFDKNINIVLDNAERKM